MQRTIKNTFRLLQIGRVLAKHDALFIFEVIGINSFLIAACSLLGKKQPSNLSKGKRLVAAIEELGPTFIKLGQSISTRSDLIGEELAKDLIQLQDRIAPFPTDIARRTIEEDFGKPISELFIEFDNTPAAAASIAQVHFAKTNEGRDVAVKILRPDIQKAFDRDTDLFFWLAELVEGTLPSFRRYKPVEVVTLFRQAIYFELDLRFEASAAVEFRDNLKKDKGFVVPEVFWTLTSPRVLTSERFFGIPMNDVERIVASGYDRNQLLQYAAISLFNQVFRDGYFHADLHPGNLFVLDSGEIGVIDFGIMGRLSKESRVYLAQILRGFLMEDYRFLADVHLEAGYVPEGTNMDLFAQALMAITKPIIGKKLNEISVARLLGQLIKTAEMFQMETQPHLLLLQKTMMISEGVGRMLNPDINMWEISKPLIESWGRENLGVKAKIQDTVMDGITILRKFPQVLIKLDRTLDELHQRAATLESNLTQRGNTTRKRIHRDWLIFAWAALFSALIVFFAVH
jgi:ubiquinone biosynthesis protein